ncbi:hypothetical protein H4582DRAFT_2112706 [Lactarius indigo]|nr:hypothetical protein H4582DRAFT_2112706 [Lactarius indigo]
MTSQRSRRPSIHINSFTSLSDLYTDARLHGYQGLTRTVRLPRAAASSGGTIAKSEDGERCVVAGKESLRILRVSDSPNSLNPDHKSSVGRGGHRIDASRNLWNGSGLKMESVSTDVAWGRGSYDNKILTSARNGELIMWDLNKIGPSKYERRTRQHLRSIHVLAYSPIVSNYCMTGSADGDIRVWDLRDMRNSVVRLHHPTAVRTAAFSCSQACPVHAVVGLDNGSLYRYDFSMGSKGQLDRLPVAHTGPILALDWCTPDGGVASSGGWIASGSLDRTVKVWDLTGPHFERTPTYTLSTQFPIRRVRWRPGYECEIAVACRTCVMSQVWPRTVDLEKPEVAIPKRRADMGYAVEIWDVRRGYIAKWLVGGSAIEGGVTDIDFRDSHALWAQHSSGTFAQLDLRNSYRPLDAVPPFCGFVVYKKTQWEVPYDDINPHIPLNLKALGDKSYNPTVQSIGTHVFDHADQDSERLSVLAKGYVVEGSDKGKLCEINAQIALQADHCQVFQMWCLLRSLFTPNSTSSSISQPSTPPLVSLTIPETTKASASFDPMVKPHSPYPSSGDSPYPVSSTPASNSPATQVTASPQSALGVSSTTSPGPPSLFSRRPSIPAFLPNRPLSTPSLAPTDNSTLSSLRHVGEGTLDDSDSSGSDSDISSLPSASALSPTAQAFPRTTLSTAPSPLSRVAAAGQQTWTEDEREFDEDSPSPASTETESEGETTRKHIRARSQSLRRRAGARSRSSTLAAPPIPAPPLQRPGFAQQHADEVRDVIRKALQEALEEYADAGDVQTCAMMALVASKELGLNRRRVQRFVEAYIELLTRMRLHTTAAYLRKHSVLPDIRSLTNLQTTVYVSCGRCGKPILAQRNGSTCANCRTPAARCSICHLPVKSMLFHCAICSHGGHQICYRRFYAKMPSVLLPTPLAPSPASPLKTHHRLARSTSRSNYSEGDDINVPPDCSFETSTVTPASSSQLQGHPCAAGCGHFCWVTNLREDEEKL